MRGLASWGSGSWMRRLVFLAAAAAIIPACGGGGGGAAAPGGVTWTLLYTDAGGGGTIEVNNAGTVRRIQGSFFNNLDLSAGIFVPFTGQYLLNAPVYMGQETGGSQANKNLAVLAGPTLTIPAGTTILGKGGVPPSMLVIRRGAKIMAQGTAVAPIVFTSSQAVGSRAPGDWGGIVINGNAPVNDTNAGVAVPLGEGNSGQYGSIPGVAADNSGILTYVRIEFAGHIFTSDDELNGLALQGVGNGTTIHHIQLHRSSDDGLEFFGGTVNVDHVVISGSQDDSLDWTSGWIGSAQFVIAQQHNDLFDNGIEADNLNSNNNALPRSFPSIANMTLIGSKAVSTSGNQGMLLRRGTAANISHAIVMNFRINGFDIDDVSTFENAYTDNTANGATFDVLNGNLTVNETVYFDNGAGGPPGTTHFVANEGAETAAMGGSAKHATLSTGIAQVVVTPLTAGATNLTVPNFRPVDATIAPLVSPALGFGTRNGYTFTGTTYKGALDHVAGNDWTTGWTSFPQN